MRHFSPEFPKITPLVSPTLPFLTPNNHILQRVECFDTRRWLVPIQETRHNVCAVLYAGIAVIAFCKGEVFGTRRWLVPIQETRHKAWYFAVAHTTAQTSARLACSFLYPFQRLRKRKLNGYKKTECTLCMHSAKFVVGVTGLEPMAS